jgi:hypothetical protein
MPKEEEQIRNGNKNMASLLFNLDHQLNWMKNV